MTIGLVLSTPPGYSETFFYSKIKGLQAQGIEIVLFTQNTKATFNLCPVKKAPQVYANPLFQLVAMFGVYLSLLPKIGRLKRYIALEREERTAWPLLFKRIYLNAHLLKANVDWLHFGFATQALGSETVANAIGAKMAVSFRGFDIGIYPIKNPNCYVNLWKYVDKVHTISDDLLQKAFDQGLSKSIPVQKITPAIDTTYFSTPFKPFATTRRPIQILTVARLHWKKGLVDTLEALKRVMEQDVHFQYTIVGEGKAYERIAYAAYDLGLSDMVKFVGKKSREEIKQLYSQSELYLQYSIQEGFCNAVLEAQAMGLLCVVSDAEGLAENVVNGKTGWVVPKNSPTALADKIMAVLKLSDSEKNSIADQAVNRVKQQFTIQQQQADFVKFYQDI